MSTIQEGILFVLGSGPSVGEIGFVGARGAGVQQQFAGHVVSYPVSAAFGGLQNLGCETLTAPDEEILMVSETAATPKWLREPEPHDFAAADHFLQLMLHERHVALAVKRLRKRRRKLRSFAAKDILRAAELECLPAENEGVAAKLAKIRKGEALAPVQLVRLKRGSLIVADGSPRQCVASARRVDAGAVRVGERSVKRRPASGS